MHAVLVLIDRLPAPWLGCYGRARAGTPAFDRLASESVVFDQHLATWAARVAGDQVGTFLREISRPFAARGIDWIDVPLSRHTVARNTESTLEPVVRMGAEQAPPTVACIHIGDPATPADDSELTDQGKIPALDYLIARLHAEIAASPASEQILLVVASLRGIVPIERTDTPEPLRNTLSEYIQTPLLVRVPGRTWGSRRQALVTTDDVLASLREWFQVAGSDDAGAGHSLLPLIRHEARTIRDQVVIESGGTAAALRTPEWHLMARLSPHEAGAPSTIAAEGARLFRKPEDAWDILDVADQNRPLVEELLGKMDVALSAANGTPLATASEERGRG